MQVVICANSSFVILILLCVSFLVIQVDLVPNVAVSWNVSVKVVFPDILSVVCCTLLHHLQRVLPLRIVIVINLEVLLLSFRFQLFIIEVVKEVLATFKSREFIESFLRHIILHLGAQVVILLLHFQELYFIFFLDDLVFILFDLLLGLLVFLLHLLKVGLSIF